MQKRLPLAAGTILQGRYRVLRQLGRGGMGAVYEAENERVSALVALKETFADDDYTRYAFEREAKMLANMTHEAFPRVMDYFSEGDGYYLVMELIRGKDLADLLDERSEPFETEQVLEWIDQILDALEDLHSQNIIHRDIKPSNLKLTPRGRLKLLDFGIAKGAAGDMTAIQSTVGSMAAATLQYAPLEQVLRADPNYYAILSVHYAEKVEEILQSGTDARSDLYALAATVYQLLTKTLPVNAPTRALALWSGQADKLRPAHEVNPQVPSEISSILDRAMRLERENRPASAAEMRHLLRQAEKSATHPIETNKSAQPTALLDLPATILSESNKQEEEEKPSFVPFHPKSGDDRNEKIVVNLDRNDAMPLAEKSARLPELPNKNQKAANFWGWSVIAAAAVSLIMLFKPLPYHSYSDGSAGLLLSYILLTASVLSAAVRKSPLKGLLFGLATLGVFGASALLAAILFEYSPHGSYGVIEDSKVQIYWIFFDFGRILTIEIIALAFVLAGIFAKKSFFWICGGSLSMVFIYFSIFGAYGGAGESHGAAINDYQSAILFSIWAVTIALTIREAIQKRTSLSR